MICDWSESIDLTNDMISIQIYDFSIPLNDLWLVRKYWPMIWCQFKFIYMERVNYPSFLGFWNGELDYWMYYCHYKQIVRPGLCIIKPFEYIFLYFYWNNSQTRTLYPIYKVFWLDKFWVWVGNFILGSFISRRPDYLGIPNS